MVERALRTRSAENVWMVRTNALESGLLEADVAALTDAEPDVLVLPKATPEAIDCLCPEGPPIVAIVETAVGVREAHAIGAAARVLALALGAVDLSLRLRLRPLPGGKELLFARSKLVVD